MKCLVALTFFVYFGIECCNAQKKIDEAYLKCQYDYTYVEDTLSGRTAKDWLVLLIGKDVSKCYSYYSMQIDSIFASPNRGRILHQQINAAIGSKTEWPHKRMKAYVYKNYPHGKIMEATSEGNSHAFKLLGMESVSKEPIVFSKTYVGNNKFEKTTYKKFLKEQYKFLFGDFQSQTQLQGIDIPNIEKVGTKSWKYKPLECL